MGRDKVESEEWMVVEMFKNASRPSTPHVQIQAYTACIK